jgi:hypothetical protein
MSISQSRIEHSLAETALIHWKHSAKVMHQNPKIR